MLTAGASEDKPMVAARVAGLGFGRDLGAERPAAEEIAEAVSAMLAPAD